MSGLELARKLRRGPHAQPVIIVTADGSPEVLRDLQKAGVSQCFPKPFPIDGLRRSVRQALETAERRRVRRVDHGARNGSATRGSRVAGPVAEMRPGGTRSRKAA
jgi:DNA-binding NtrC family response regulator